MRPPSGHSKRTIIGFLMMAALAIFVASPSRAGEPPMQSTESKAPQSRYPDKWWFDLKYVKQDTRLYTIHGDVPSARFGAFREIYELAPTVRTYPGRPDRFDASFRGVFSGTQLDVVGLGRNYLDREQDWLAKRLEPDPLLRKHTRIHGFEFVDDSERMGYVSLIPLLPQFYVEEFRIPETILQALKPRLDAPRIFVIARELDALSYERLIREFPGPNGIPEREICRSTDSVHVGVRVALENGEVVQRILWKKVPVVPTRFSNQMIRPCPYLQMAVPYSLASSAGDLEDGTFLFSVGQNSLFRIRTESGCTKAPPARVRMIDYDVFQQRVTAPMYEFGKEKANAGRPQIREYERLLRNLLADKSLRAREKCQ